MLENPIFSVGGILAAIFLLPLAWLIRPRKRKKERKELVIRHIVQFEDKRKRVRP